MKTAALALLFALVLGAAAAAQDRFRLAAAEVRALLFGAQLIGVHGASGALWTECVSPDGRTLFQTGRGVLAGRLAIKADGQACFSYAEDRYRRQNCFAVERVGARLWLEPQGAIAGAGGHWVELRRMPAQDQPGACPLPQPNV